MIKQQLTTRQQQKLSPLQIQQVKLLELTTLELENRINSELEENPALEEIPGIYSETESDNPDDQNEDRYEDDPFSDDLGLGDYLTEDDIPDYKLQQSYQSRETTREEISYAESESFQEYLTDQLRLKNLSPHETQIGFYLLGNMDEDGYLRREPEAISDDLAFQYSIDIPAEEIRKVIAVIQELDPPGVGAFNLQECLLLQLKRKEPTPVRTLTAKILTQYFDAFSKKQYEKIIKSLDISEDQMKAVVKEITLLNPRPGGAWESALETKLAQIQPDFYVETSNGELYFTLLEKDIPELRVNKEYSDLLRAYSQEKSPTQHTKDTVQFVKQKLDSAKWFIDAIKQRHLTLETTMLAILDIQRDFFLSGEETDLKPMILKDVAERCSYDISTISRVSNSKYVQTNWGIYPLKFFFSESLTNEESEEVSTRAIKAILKKCIDSENKIHPKTDDILVKELKQQGYDIARRTVAKYREQLNIPVARLRKTI
ncbi:MAG: RNA polymerase factor sigma-54 [Dysgonamonadaceae bacterium]|jgi:RNA polymerase sigma-54 factor|nr:RNA polymerase factor sigma-54 [Dysgonamonadaceae bacterium]